MVEISKLVDDLIKKYDTNDPFKLASYLDIWVYKCELGKKINGHYIYAKRKKVFFINSELTNVGSIITCAHELGHALLHTKTCAYFSYKNEFENLSHLEIECNKFAIELLSRNNYLKNNINPNIKSSIIKIIPNELNL